MPTQTDGSIYFDDLQWQIIGIKCPAFASRYGLTTFKSQSDAKFVWDLKRLWSSSLHLCSWLKVGTVWNCKLLPPISIRLPGDQACSLAGGALRPFFSHGVCFFIDSVIGIPFGYINSFSIHHSPFCLQSAACGLLRNLTQYAFTRHEQRFATASTSQINPIDQASINYSHVTHHKQCRDYTSGSSYCCQPCLRTRE